MGFTRVEFMRILPAALHDYPFRVEDSCIFVNIGDKTIQITLGEEQVRRIALLALPYIPVEFDYSQIDETDFKTFLKQFDLYYRKGGG